ncbi:hypothetical protein SG34_020285 [Thalassomonas viridans]|uniref:Uncharacterized protein n=1 Tax=Thalassomonas viridans TaxID=137584 RepID=A0AAF0C5U9_9GAMM|nr:hypothetical protein [Thalassomonas viridans]WDE03702.1 hypothetical protein SG34_020285 [Thalassomonas viridans]
MEIIFEDWLALCAVILIFLWGIATFCFSRISVKYIECEMAKEGQLPPEWDKGIGARITMYAMVIVAKKAADVSPVNDQLILRYARKKDWYLAVFFLGSFVVLMCVGGIAYYLYGPE